MIDFIKGNRRDAVPSKSPGWKAFLDWQAGPHRRSRPISPVVKAVLDLHARILRRSLDEAADEFRIQLGERTGKLTHEIESMPLLDAVRLLDRSLAPEAASAPAAPPPPGDRTPAGPASTGSDGESRGDRQATDVAAESKRTRRPRRISKVQSAIAILLYRRERRRESIRVEDIAKEAKCSAQNLYKSPEFKRFWKAAQAKRIRRGWKIEGVADCPDDSTLDVG